MKKITLEKVQQMTSPNPITLVCTKKPDGSTNLAALSWWMYLSNDPAKICFAMYKSAYSGELVREDKKVLLAMPSAEIAEAAFFCGISTGRETDKVKEYHIDMMDVQDNTIKAPVHSRIIFDCSMTEFIDAGDHYLYICDVKNMYGNEEKQQIFAWEGYSKLRPLS